MTGHRHDGVKYSRGLFRAACPRKSSWSGSAASGLVPLCFRGTNVHDAAEATLAVISRLAAHPTALVFVASHVGDVVPALLDDPRIALRCLAADLTGDRPRFDYRPRDGASEQRLGMTLRRQEGVLERLEPSVKSARASGA